MSIVPAVIGLERIRDFFYRLAEAPLASPLHADYGEVYAAVRQGSILATAFHPELTSTAFHKWLIREAKR